MAWPEPSIHDHEADWNMDQDEETGEWYCSCARCQRKARDEARAEREIDDR